jgi:hypothetical protein
MDTFILVGQSVVGAFEQEEWEYFEKLLKDDDGCIIIWDSATEHVSTLLDMLQGWSDFFALTQEDMDLIKKNTNVNINRP